MASTRSGAGAVAGAVAGVVAAVVAVAVLCSECVAGVSSPYGPIVNVDLTGALPAGTGFRPSVAVDPVTSELFVAVTNDAAGVFGKLAVLVCAPDSLSWSCRLDDASVGAVGSDTGTKPVALRVPGSSSLAIVSIDTAQARALMLTVCDTSGPSLVCTARNVTVIGSPRTMDDVSAVLSPDGDKILMVAAAAGAGNVPWMAVCTSDGTGCVDGALPGAVAGSGHTPSVALDPTSGTLYVATRSPSGPRLFVCPNAVAAVAAVPPSCTVHDTSVGAGADSGFTPTVMVSSSHVYVAMVNKESAASETSRLVRCGLDGSGCTAAPPVAPAPPPPGSAVELAAVLDVDAGLVVMVARNGAPSPPLARMILCAMDLSGCSSSTMAAETDLGYEPAVAVVSGRVFAVVATGSRLLRGLFSQPFDGASSTLLAPPSRTEAVVGTTVEFGLDLRNGSGAVHRTPSGQVPLVIPGWDFEAVTRVDSAVVSHTWDLSGYPRVVARVAAPTFSLYAASMSMSGAPWSDNTTSLDLALNDTLTYVADVPGDGTFTASTQDPFRVEVVLRGAGDTVYNVVPGYSYPQVEVSLKIGVSALNGTRVAASAAGGLAVQFQPTFPSAHLLTVKAGTFSVGGSPYTVNVALECGPGARVSETECVPCTNGTFHSGAVSTQTCTSCPDGMGGPVGAVSGLNCTCAVGEWFGSAVRDPERGCQACPDGGVCRGGHRYPTAAPGFFARDANGFAFVRCLRNGCVGGSQCAAGYKGYLCGTCQDGYYSSSERECSRCPSGAGGRFASMVVGVLAVAVAAGVLLAWSVARTLALSKADTSAQGAISAFRQRTLPVTISLVVSMLQVWGVLATLDLGWSSEASSVLNVFALVNVDAQAVAAECSLASFHTMYVLTLVVLGGFLGVVVGTVLVVRAVGPGLSGSLFGGLESATVAQLVDASFFTAGPVVYLPIARAALVLLDCTRLPDGTLVLDADTGVKCLDSDWWAVFPVCVVAVAVAVVGVPVYFAYTLWAHSTTLFDGAVMLRYGSLYRNFCRHTYWGELVLLGRRLVIAVVGLFLSRHQLVQIVLFGIVIVAGGAFVLGRMPYYYVWYNAVELRLTGVTLAMFMVGVGSYAERTSGSGTTFLLVVMVAVVVAMAAVSVHAVVADVLSIRRERGDPTFLAEQRHARIVSLISSELNDVDNGPELLHAAGEFLATLDNIVHERDVSRKRSMVQMDTLTADDALA